MTGERHVVHLVQPVGRSRQELWQAASTPEGLSGWYADRVTGSVEAGATVRLEWPDLGASVDLDVVECSPRERVSFDNGESRVTLVITEGALELTHAGLGATDDHAGFHSSWRVALAHLSHGLEVHPGRKRRASWLVRKARTSAGLAHLCFTEPSALGSWLGRPAQLGQEGEPYSVTLEDGRRMAGRVLVREAGHDVVLTWQGPGRDSLISLRTLPSPRGSTERLVALCWSSWTEAAQEDIAATQLLSAAMDRLTTVLSRRGDA